MVSETTKKPTRVKDGELSLFEGRLVNRQRMAKLLECRPTLVSAMMKRPNGLPHIKEGQRYWFDPEAVLEWFKSRQTSPAPTQGKRR